MKLRLQALLMALTFVLASVGSTVALAEDFTPSTLYELSGFENFEGYSDTLNGKWSCASNADVDSPSVITAGGTKAYEVYADTSLRHETYLSADYDPSKMTTMILGFSFCIDELASSAYITFRTGKHIGTSFKLSTTKNLILGDKTMDFVFDTDEWYDVIIEQVPSTGYIRAHIKSADTDEILETYCTVSESTKEGARLSFIADKVKTAGGVTKVYFDNLFVYGSDKTPTSYAPALDAKGYDFEDFVSSEDGLTFPEGIADDNANTEYINVYADEGCNSEKSLKIVSNTPKKYPTLRTNIGSFSGKSVLEFDYKPTEESRPRFGIRGNTKANKGVGATVSMFAMYDGGELIFCGPGGAFKEKENNDDVLIGVLTPNEWHHFKFNFDTDAYTFDLTVTGDSLENPLTLSDSIPEKSAYENTYIIKQLDMFYFGETSVDYIDNIVFRDANTVDGVIKITPSNTEITPDITTIDVVFTGNVEDIVSDAMYKINGSTEGFTTSVSGNIVSLVFDTPPEFDTHYLLEVCGIGKSGNEFYMSTALRTVKKIDIQEMRYEQSTIQSGEINAGASVISNSSEYSKAMLMTIVYEKASGKMVSVSIDEKELLNGEKTDFASSVTVPESSENYRVITYLWDGIGEMNTLCKPIILE
ncbi:MAG: hypothetical protein IJB70_04020 [Clostridia bacterium]|nr:hypothetical protein [Clostridia bacterium]